MRNIILAFVIAATIAGLTSCGGAGRPGDSATAAAETDRPLSVFVVNYPLHYFAERIGGELVSVSFPAPADGDPAYWSPDAATVAAYQGADLILLNGANYARWISRASLPTEVLVDTSGSFSDRLIPLEDAVTHSHGPEGEHEHGDAAFTTWLDPQLAIEQARAVAAAFAKARPESEAQFLQGLTSLEADLQALDERQAAVAQRVGDERLVFSHPVYQYLVRRYGLNGRALHWEPDQAPDLRELDELRKSHPARWMVWEGAPPAETVRALEAAGLSSLVYEPCGNTPETGDYLSVMQRNVAALEGAFSND
jgi:zinc transport system substrate-binding protein